MDSLDLDDGSFSKKRSKLPWIAAAAVVLAGGAFTFANLGGGSESEAAPAAAAVQAPAAEPIEEGAYIPPTKADPDAPLDLGNAGYEVSAAETKAFAKEEEKEREMREKMAEALAGAEQEKEKVIKQLSENKKKVSKASWKPPVKKAPKKSNDSSSSALKQGGSAYDPLNSSLP